MQINLSLLFFISKYKIYKDSSLLNNTQNLKSGLYLYILYEQLLTDKLPHNIATWKPKKKFTIDFPKTSTGELAHYLYNFEHSLDLLYFTVLHLYHR